MRIKAIGSGCNCLDIQYTKTDIDSSRPGEISFKWETNRFRNNTEQIISVLIEDEPDYSIPIVIKAHVTPEVSYTPSKIYWNGKDSKAVFVELRSDTAKLLKIAGIYPNSSCIEIGNDLRPDQNGFTIFFKPNGSPMPNGTELNIQVAVTGTKFKWIHIPIVIDPVE